MELKFEFNFLSGRCKTLTYCSSYGLNDSQAKRDVIVYIQ